MKPGTAKRLARHAAQRPLTQRTAARRDAAAERQARTLAARFADGARGLHVTPAPAATFRLPGSIGRPLPPALRGELEAAFDADLRALRVHDDATAAAAAQALGAMAYASGRHIVFGHDRYMPGTEPGRRLIAHEVAHALQQTGRATIDRRLRVTDATGGGLPQCEELPDFDYLKRAHAPSATSASRAAYDAVVQTLEPLMALADPKSALQAFALATIPTLRTLKWPHHAESLLYDACKQQGLYELAAQLIERDNFLGGNRVNTVGWSGGVLTELQKRNGGWAVYAEAIRSVGWLKGYERDWLKQFEDFAIGNRNMAVEALPRTAAKGGSGTIGDHLQALYEQLTEYRTVSNNEWIYRGLLLMRTLDGERVAGCRAIRDKSREDAGTSTPWSFVERRLRAQAVVEWGETLHERAGEFSNFKDRDDKAEIATALKPYLKRLGEQVSAIGSKAKALWEQAVSIEQQLAPDEDDDAATVQALTERRELAARLGAGKGVPAVLAKLLQDLNRNQPGDDPRRFDATIYRERAEPWVQQLGELSDQTIATERLAAFRTGHDDQALAWIALDAFVMRLRSHMLWSADGEVQSTTGRPPVSSADDARYQRIVVAEWIRWVAKPLDWTVAISAADQILQARLEPQSVLAILAFDDGELFKLDGLADDAMFKQAREDGGTRAIRGLEPFTLETLVIFYRGVFLRDLAGELRRITPASNQAEQAVVDAGTAVPYLVAEAKKALATPQPQRWHVYDSRYAPKAGDTRDFGDVVTEHPAYRELLASKVPAGFDTVVPAEPIRDIYVWSLPPHGGMDALLRTSKIFQGLVADTFGARLKPETRFERQSKLPLDDWLQRLRETLAKKLKDAEFLSKEWPAMVKHLYDLTMGDYNAALAEFRTAFVRAMRRDRQLIAAQLRPLLQRHADDHHDYAAIKAAIRLLSQFDGANAVLEDADRERQMALLLIEVAPQFHDALEYARIFDIVYAMLAFTEPALPRARALLYYNVAQRQPWLPDHENTDAWIEARLKPLEKTAEHLREVRESVQKSRGFEADKEKQHIVAYVKYSSPLPLLTPLFPRHGGLIAPSTKQGFRVTEVMRSFIYHPAYGSSAGAAGYSPPQFLEPDGKTELAAADDEPLLRLQIIERKPADDKAAKDQEPQFVAIKSIVLTRQNLQEFDDLYNGLTWAGFGSAMQNVQAGIEAFLEFYLDVAELIPGVGPAIAAARITAALAEFLTSADYEALLEAVKGGLADTVTGLLDTLVQQVDSDQIVLFLLFGDPRLELLLARSTLGTGEAKAGGGGSSGRFGALKKIVDAFRRLGRALFKALRKLDRYVMGPMQDVRIFASTRPLLSFALQFAADHIFQIVRLAQQISRLIAALDSADKDADRVREIEADIKAQQAGFGQQLHDVVQALQNFKLPHEVIDIAPAIAVVLTVAEGFVIKRTGFAGKVINLALKHSGAYDVINQHFAQAIVDAGADPNVIWRDEVVPKIEKQFNQARDDLVARLNEVLQSKVFKDVFDPVPAVTPLKVETDPGMHFEETSTDYIPPAGEADVSPQPSADRPLVPRPASLPRPDAGQPLTPPMRRGYERRIGHDLGHVRLHAGTVGQRMTDAFGADALTSGSHVYVRRGKLAETLDHELVHVVQQTGARPLGRAHDATPVAGHPERGLDYRPENEAQAEAVAAAMRSGGGVHIGGAARPAGLAPSGVNWFTIARLMREVSNLEAVTESAKKIEAFTGTAKVDRDVQAAIDKLLAVLKAPSKNAALWRYPGPFKDAMPLVEARLASATYFDKIQAGAKVIAMESMEPVDAKPGEPRYLAASEFARGLEAYVLASTGIAVALKLNDRTVSVPGKDFDTVELANPLDRISLVHIHLPLIDGRARLWAVAIDNTWKTKDADYKQQMRRALRPLLESEGIRPGIWPLFGSEFRFSLLFKGEAERYLKQRQGERPDPVPTWQDYVKTDKSEKTGIIGLRLATYEHASQRGTGRQSHHLTQYLLAEFFANANSAKAFDGAREYPGVFPTGTNASNALGSGTAGTIASKESGGDKIDVKATNGSGRGEKMPTISLAAVTHQRGKLHVTPEPDDAGTSIKSTQGSALQNEFQRRLPPEVVSSSAATYDAYLKKEGRDAVAQRIYNAAQKTYSVVEHHMSSQLAKNMAPLEYQYYSGLVEGATQDNADKTNPDTETEAQKAFKTALDAIPALAKTHNRTVMSESFGWKTT